jgi:hypothetical protein
VSSRPSDGASSRPHQQHQHQSSADLRPQHQPMIGDTAAGPLDGPYSRLSLPAITGPSAPYYNGSVFRTTPTGNGSSGGDVASSVYFQTAADIYRPSISTPAAAAAAGVTSSLLSSSALTVAAGSGYYEKCSI